MVFWATDPARHYPRYMSRYAPDPAGMFVPNGRRDRVVVAVDVGDERGPADADVRVQLSSGEELDAVAALRAGLGARAIAGAGDLSSRMSELAKRLTSARYVVIIYDAERASEAPRRSEALIALTQQLNGTGRASLSTLRGGGNRTGAEAVLTWQTGFPMTVDFSRGAPHYRPDDGAAALLQRGDVDVVLIVGDPRAAAAFDHAAARRVVIGPRASEHTPPADVAIDTGVAGIHDEGVVFRMDDVPLPLRRSLAGPPSTVTLLDQLLDRLGAPARGSAP
jgi:formylmethanofuran dehydrogenase subunit B